MNLTELSERNREAREKLWALESDIDEIDKKAHRTAGDTERMRNLEKAAERALDESKKSRAAWEQAISQGIADGTLHVESTDPDENPYTRMTADPLRNPREAEAPYRGDPWRGLPNVQAAIQRSLSPSELRSRAYSAIEKTPGPSDALREHATELIREWDDDQGSISQYILLTSDPAYTRAFSRMMRGEKDLLTDAERIAVARVRDYQRAMSLTDGSGGFAVPFTLDPSIQITGAGSQSDIAKIARNVVTTTDKWSGVTAGQISAAYQAEAAEVADAAPTLLQPAVDIFMSRVFVPASIEIIGDMPNWSEEIAKMMLDAVQRLEAEKFVLGSGSAEPEGIVVGLTGAANALASAGADTLAIADLYAAWEAVPARHRDSASWLANELIYDKIRQFGTANNYHGFSVDLTDSASSRLLGRPAYRSSHMDGSITGSADNYVLIAADMESTFVIARRIGFTIEMVQTLFSTTTNLPSGQRGLFGYARNGSAVVDGAAGALLNVT